MTLVYKKEFLFKEGHFTYKTFNQRPRTEILGVHQVHGNALFEGHLPIPEKLSEADGIFCSFHEKNLPKIAIVTADCLPITLIGSHGMALIHAGWKGLKANIVQQPQLLRIRPFFAFIGPHIRDCCYEVDQSFSNHFPETTNLQNNTGPQFFFSLEKEASHQLKKAFPNLKLDSSHRCTKCHEKFHSYRRNQTEKRNWNILEKR
ncbi:MAG: polyphenol oxidase family protein [Bdellovibrionota bacterium]|nr:polyphenol oxidase family protein [Bdellovibrionota bacterium]